MRRSIREEQNRERRIALQQRWHVGALATIVAGALVFSGMTPAVADEAVTPDATQAASTEPEAPAEEPAAPAEEAPAEEAPAEEPAAPAEEAPAEEAPAEEAPAPDEGAVEEPVADAPAKRTSAAKETEVAAALVASCALNGSFEIDGNYTPGDCGGNDWSNVNDSSTGVVGTYQVVKDNSNPATWNSGGGTPPKVDFITVYSYAETIGDEYFLNVAWEREQTSGTGGYVIEVTNAGATLAPDGAPRPNRTNGGAVFYITTQGSEPPILLQSCVYTSVANYPGTCTAGTGGFVSAVSVEDQTNPDGVAVESGGFFEIGLNVTELTDGGVKPGCPAAANATAYMRSFTGNNFGPTGNLKGYVAPLGVTPPSTCGSLTIIKNSPTGAGLAGATFTVSPNPATGTGSVEVVTGAGGTFTFANTVKPGTYTVTETSPPPGYLLPAQTSQQVTVGAKESKSVTFVDPLGSASWLKHDRAGNLLGGATFQVTATAGAATAAPWDLDSSPITVVDNTGQPGYSGRDTDATAGEFTVTGLPTGTYSVVETAAPAGYVLDPSSKSFTISQQTPNPTISVAFVNTPFTKVTLTKVWVDSFAGDTAQLSIGGAATANGTSTAPTTGPAIEVSVAPGSSLTLAEALGGGNTGVYTSTLSCVGATVTDNTGTGGSITAPTWPASANGVQCTFTNTAVKKTVTLQKYWVDAIQGDTAQLTAGTAKATSTATGAATQLDTTNVAVATVRVGDTITLSEALGGQGVYGSSYSCTNGVTGDGMSFQLTVPNGNTVCTFENEAERATVTLKKQWVDAFAGDTAHLDIDGAETDSATSVATEGDSTDNVNTASVTVRLGDEVTLSEELGEENTGSYTSTWSCDDGTSGQGGSIPEFSVTESVVCTIKNTAKTTDIIVNKVWVDAFQGDDAVLSINDEDGTSTATGAANQTDDGVVELTVRVGESVTVAETLAGDNRGQYTSTYACTSAGGQGSGRTTTFTAPEADVECTFTNTAVKVGVVLQKRWIGGLALDQARLSLVREGAAELFNTSVADGFTFDLLDNVKTVFAQVRIGEILTLSETVTGLGTYESKYLCSAGAPSGDGNGRTFQLNVTGATVCIFANRALTQSVSVTKTWVNGQAGDTADLGIEGGATGSGQSTADGSVGEFTDVENTVTADALIGEEVTVSELIGVVAGDESDYTSSLVCVGADETVYVDDDVREGTFTMPNQPVDCMFVNEAELPTIALEKTVAGADVSDTNWQLFATPEEGDVVTDDDGGDVEPTEVPTDTEFALSEELIGDFAGDDEFEAGEWSCVSDVSGELELGDSVPGSAMLGGLDKGENVVCMIVNSHVDQGYELDKSLVSSEQNEDGTWTVTYEITVHNNSQLVSREYDLTDTIDATDGVVLSASWSGPTEGTFPEGELEAQLADDQVLAPYAGTDDVYTVVVEAEVTAVPQDTDPCTGEESGVGIVNTATLTVEDDEPIDDDACGTIHLDDVGLEKTSSSSSVEPGVEFDYVLTVTNYGTRDAESVHVRDADLHERLDIVGLELQDGFTILGGGQGWTENGGGQVNDIVDLHLTESLGVGESMTVTIRVVLTPQPAVSSSDPAAPVPAPPAPLDSLVNNACVDTEIDTVGGPFDGEPFAPNCDDLTIEVREMTGVVYTACVSDTAVLRYIIRTSPSLSTLPVSGSWVTVDEPNVSGHSLTIDSFFANPQGVSGEIQWPGSMFVGNPPVAVDYPGWRALEADDYGPNGGYINPADGLEYAPEDAAFFVFNGLILDPSELDFAWRGQSTVTFEVNPTLTFNVEYPTETAECVQARHSDVQIEKTASADRIDRGGQFTYDIAVENMSADSAADGVVVTDEIPSDIRILDITWPGMDDAEAFPNWDFCEITGTDGDGYGGLLECQLFGPLQPQGTDEGATAAPTLTLLAEADPLSPATTIENIAAVDYHTFGDPEDVGHDEDNAIVTVPTLVLPEEPEEPLPATGGTIPWTLALFGFLALVFGTTLVVARRRRGEAKPML